MTRPDLPAGTGLALVVLVVLIMVSVIGDRGGGGAGSGPVAPSLVALSPLDGRSPREPAGSELRVLVELPRPALAERDDLDTLSPAEQRGYVRSLQREGAALRSALGARGVSLRDAVTFGRTWDGFAATVDTSDLAALSSLGVRAQPVRRFYPATSEPVPVPLPRPGVSSPASPRPPKGRAAPADQAPIAVLDTGAEGASGYDALDRDADPAPRSDPRAPARRETTGTALAGVVAAAGERVMSIRVAGYGTTGAELHGTTDALLLGLERAVDPDGDGATDDAVRVALVGVNAPYAGFGDSPEAQAARGAAKLGTLVVAPAGNEGVARPPNGVVGSPGAARAALAVGATEAGAGAA
ncbi:MAG: S8 family serine peptidase, partial [Solirubrobacteraceae bacterium]